VIRITTQPAFILFEDRKRDPDLYEVLLRLHCTFGEAQFQLRPEFRPPTWVHNRYRGAVQRLFASEFIAVVEESVH
jgi:hypothetical protein